MPHALRLLPILVLLFVLPGCYQAQVTTDRTAGETVVHKKWASSYLNGLVPAKLDVSNDCPNGIAAAERKFTFLNGLVSTLTLGIYLPHDVKVTCAASSTAANIGSTSNPRITPQSETR
jgi:hypothetical protein